MGLESIIILQFPVLLYMYKYIAMGHFSQEMAVNERLLDWK